MTEQTFTTTDLVLAVLHSERDSSRRSRGTSLSSVVDRVHGTSNQLSKQVEIGVAVDQLVREGAVERTNEERLVLTDSGRTRANETMDALHSTDIELVDGEERRSVSLDVAADSLGLDVITVASACADEGVYYNQEEPPVTGLIGRSAERETIESAVQRVRETGTGECLLLSGPSGVGKTTLVETVLDECSPAVSTASVGCQGTGGEPYQPIRDLLGQLGAETDPFSGDTLSIEDNETYEAQRTAVFHEITAHLAPTEGVRVLFFDDVGVVDGATWSYLTYLYERLQSQPLVLIGAHRPGALPEQIPFSVECDDETSTTVTRIPLGGLSSLETKQLVEQVVGRRPAPDSFAQAVHERTDGMPLFVEKTVETLLARDELDSQYEWYPDTSAAIDLPDAAQETIGRQLELLDDESRDVLEWAAVAGESVILSVLQAVCDKPRSQIRTILDTLTGAGTLDETHDGTRIAFQNSVVRKAILGSLESEDQRARHEAIAAALTDKIKPADDGATERAATIAYHYEQAQSYDQTIEWYRTAATHATDVYAHETATEYYNRVLDIARTADRDQVLLAVGLELADLYLTTGTYDQAERYVQFVRERLDEDDIDRRRQCARLAGAIAAERGGYDDAIDEAVSGIELTAERDRIHCQLLETRADAEWAKGDYDAARETSKQLRDCADELGLPELRATATYQLGVLAMEQSEYDKAREQYQMALGTAQAIEERHLAADAQMGLGVVAKRKEEYDRAHDHWQSAQEDYDAVGDRHQAAKIANNLGLVAKQRTEYEQAREYYEDALSRLEALGDRDTAALVRVNLGNVAELRGEYERSREYLDAALDTFETVGRRHHAAVTRLNLGDLLVTFGEYDRARTQLQEALTVTREVDDTLREAKVLWKLGRLERNNGEFQAASDYYDDAVAAAESVDNKPLLAEICIEQAKLSLAKDSYERARAQCQEALDHLDGEDAPICVARAVHVLGRTELAAANDEQAQERIVDALETFSERGVLGDAVDALESLTRLSTENSADIARQWCDRLTTRAQELELNQLADRVESVCNTVEES